MSLMNAVFRQFTELSPDYRRRLGHAGVGAREGMR